MGTSLTRQQPLTTKLQDAATADGNGNATSVTGMAGTQLVAIQKTGVGTCTVIFEGSLDGATWYTIGYQRIDAQVAPARSVTALSVTTGAFHQVVQILDRYPWLRARMATTAGALALDAALYAVPAS